MRLVFKLPLRQAKGFFGIGNEVTRRISAAREWAREQRRMKIER